MYSAHRWIIILTFQSLSTIRSSIYVIRINFSSCVYTAISRVLYEIIVSFKHVSNKIFQLQSDCSEHRWISLVYTQVSCPFLNFVRNLSVVLTNPHKSPSFLSLPSILCLSTETHFCHLCGHAVGVQHRSNAHRKVRWVQHTGSEKNNH